MRSISLQRRDELGEADIKRTIGPAEYADRIDGIIVTAPGRRARFDARGGQYVS